jgi:hypothetical protein
MTMYPIAAPFHPFAREQQTRSIWQRIGDVIEQRQRRRAERELSGQFRHQPMQDDFRIEFERRFVGQ